MSQKRIFPKAIDAFNTFILMVFLYLKTNATRLQIKPTSITTLQTLINDPATGWSYYFGLHSNPVTRTKTINEDLGKSETSITIFLRSIYADIPRSVMITDDYNALNIAEPTHTKGSRAAITNTPYGVVYSVGGGKLCFIVRTKTDAKRASMDPLADVIWVDAIILKPGDPMPKSPADCTITFTSRSALFSHTFDLTEKGNTFVCFLHYANLTDDSKSGPVSEPISCIIG